MIEILKTDVFDDWLKNLRDQRAKAKINVRLRRLSLGNFGDHETISDGISELRLTEGKGYRIYYCRKGDTVVILLCGGHKGTQSRDIEKAIQIAKALE